MLTDTARQLDQWTTDVLRETARTGGLDARHRFADNRSKLSAQLAGSRVSGSATAITATQRSNVHLHQRNDAVLLAYDSTRTDLAGMMSQVSLDKQGGGITRFNASAWYLTPGFEINDLGFRTRRDETGGSLWFALRPTKPFGIFLRGQLNVNAHGAAKTGGLMIGNGGTMNANGQFVNFWNAYSGVGMNKRGRHLFRPRRPRRSGPPSPASPQAWAGVDGDSRKAMTPGIDLFGGRRTDGLGRDWDVGVCGNVRFGAQLHGSIRFGYGRNIDDQQWIGNFTDGGVTSYTFARLYQSTSSITMRFDYTITPRLSVESYLQPFVSTGAYTNWRAVADGRAEDVTLRFPSYTTRGEPDGFRFGQLRTNNVVRWEYHPGSVLFFVWSQGRDTNAGDPSERGVQPGFDALLRERPRNVFLVKASYWLGR